MNTLQDKLGRSLTVGDRVAYASFKNPGMTIGTVSKLGRLRAVITPEAPAFNPDSESFRTTELIKI
jgi:hypothetical protein